MFLSVVRRISVISLVVLSLSFSAYNLYHLVTTWDPQLAAKNEVSIWENRFEPVRKGLPADVKHVGYVADGNLPGMDSTSSDQVNEFRLTRYVMAPVIVTDGLDHPWIIGNFSTHKFEAWLRDQIGDYEIQEFSGGIYLIHKVQK